MESIELSEMIIEKENLEMKSEPKEESNETGESLTRVIPVIKPPIKAPEEKVKPVVEQTPIDINILLSVEDIYKIASRNKMMRYDKIIPSLIYLFVTLQVINTMFIMIIAYHRPPLIISTYNCLDQHTMTYIKCPYRNKCKCQENSCVYFCYKKSYTECIQEFSSIAVNTKSSNTVSKVYIKYNMKDNENISILQNIGDRYCHEHLFLIGFIGSFSLGSWIGYYIFSILNEIFGKRKCILVMTVGVFLCCVPLCVLCNFKIYEKFVLHCSLWAVFLFLNGVFFLPLESTIYIYFLELNPKSEFLKSTNGLLYERYFFSIIIFYCMNQFLRNITYYFYFFEAYILVFFFIFMTLFYETPRHFSERRDIENKKLSIKNFTSELITFVQPSEDNKDNKSSLKKEKRKKFNFTDLNKKKNNSPPTIPYSEIVKKYIINKTKNKKNFLISVCFFSLTLCFYIILISIIFDMTNPNTTVKASTKTGVLIYLSVLFPLLQFPSYFCYELVDLDKYIMFFLFILSVIPFQYDLGNITIESDKVDYFGTYQVLKIKNVHPYVQASGMWLITFILSIYEILVLLQPPTLYRTLFFFRFKSWSNLAFFFAFFAVYFLEASLILVSILSLFTALLFMIMRIKWKFDPFEESIDIENNKNEIIL